MVARQKQIRKVNFYGMLQHVLIASMNKGQFPIACITIIFLVLIFKLDSDGAIKIIEDLLTILVDLRYIGWGVALVIAIMWFFSIKFLRRMHSSEISRIAKEKSSLQQSKIETKLNSSK